MRVPEIHHLIQQLVYDDEIIPYRFLLEFFEILGEYLDDFVQEEEDFGGVGVAFCEGEQIEVVVADVKILSSRKKKG